MKIFGHPLSEYFRLLAPLFGLIAAVWALRWVLDAAGAPHGLVRVVSVSVATAASVLVAAALIHTRRFGGYANVVVAIALLAVWEQLLIVTAIAFGILTGTNNIYSAPEYTPHGADPMGHIVGHLVGGIGFGTLFGAAMGCGLLWMLRRLIPVASTR